MFYQSKNKLARYLVELATYRYINYHKAVESLEEARVHSPL